MPLPFLAIPVLIKGAAVVAGVVGAGAAVKGMKSMADANDTMDKAKKKHSASLERFEKEHKSINLQMDELGKKELEILQSFEKFSELLEKIHNRPEFSAYNKDGVSIPKYDQQEMKEIYLGAGILLGGLGGAALGTAGGFAAAGATTAAMMAVGTASTGTALSSLAGAAATKATLAALGGGAIAAGGGGMAAGAAALSAATLGVGILIGGIIFSVTGSSLSSKADEALLQAGKAEKEVDSICVYFDELGAAVDKFSSALAKIYKIYTTHLSSLGYLIEYNKKTNWDDFTQEEKTLTENTALLVGVLYKMCQVRLVLASSEEGGLNAVNNGEIDSAIEDAEFVMRRNHF